MYFSYKLSIGKNIYELIEHFTPCQTAKIGHFFNSSQTVIWPWLLMHFDRITTLFEHQIGLLQSSNICTNKWFVSICTVNFFNISWFWHKKYMQIFMYLYIYKWNYWFEPFHSYFWLLCVTTSRIYVKYTNYASPSSGEAYRDRKLTTNFEFWVEIFCVPTCFHVRIPKPCLSVCSSVRTPRKEITLASSISVLH